MNMVERCALLNDLSATQSDKTFVSEVSLTLFDCPQSAKALLPLYMRFDYFLRSAQDVLVFVIESLAATRACYCSSYSPTLELLSAILSQP